MMRGVALLFWLLVCAVQPAWAQPSPRLQSLEREVAAMVASKPGEYGIAAQDLDSGDTISFNGATAFPMASTVKLAVAATYLSQVDAGRRTLADKYGGRTASELLELMITRSDNPATDSLLGMLGGPRVVDRWVRDQGFEGIRVDRTIAQLLSDRRDLKDRRDSATPLAMLELLRRIDRGQILAPDSRALLLGWMSRCITGSNRIRALLPPGTQVAHKTGTLSGLTSDVGFITLPNGRKIAVVLFARGGSNRAPTIAAAARALYDGFVEDSAPEYAAVPLVAAAAAGAN